jgi:hypothetical protein
VKALLQNEQQTEIERVVHDEKGASCVFEQQFREFSSWYTLPFYSRPSALIGLIITNDIKKSQDMREVGGSAKKALNRIGLAYHERVVHGGGTEHKFIVFLDYAYLTHGLIGHELDHVRQMIVDGLKVTRDESKAEIAEWLHEWVYEVLSANAIPIYHEPTDSTPTSIPIYHEPIEDSGPF